MLFLIGVIQMKTTYDGEGASLVVPEESHMFVLAFRIFPKRIWFTAQLLLLLSSMMPLITGLSSLRKIT
jgi:hypothetical protein